MPIWKIGNTGPARVQETKLKNENYLEEHLEGWIMSDPTILGEPLMILGRQVLIPDMKDRLDLLALDPKGNAVIIEIKRGRLKDPVDMQAMRYASYISKWTFDDFENLARQNRKGKEESNFYDDFEAFCIDSGVDDIPDLNHDQRLIIVGSEVKDKLGSVALWLHEHDIDIKVVEVEVFKEGQDILIQPQIIIPLPISRFSETGARKRKTGDEPWLLDGKIWHLEKRCSPETRKMLEKLDQIFQENLDVDGPKWDQKGYISYKVNGYNWLTVETHTRLLYVIVRVQKGAFKSSTLAKKLNIQEYASDDPLADKLGQPSSVAVKEKNESIDRITIRVKDDFDMDNPSLVEFLQKAFQKSPK